MRGQYTQYRITSYNVCYTKLLRELLPYACAGVAFAGLVYLVLSALIKIFGAKKVMRFFPPIVTGPIIIAIGLTLSKTAIDSCSANWGIALVAILVVIICNIFGKGMIKIIPVLIGIIASYIVAAVTGNVDVITSYSIHYTKLYDDHW